MLNIFLTIVIKCKISPKKNIYVSIRIISKGTKPAKKEKIMLKTQFFNSVYCKRWRYAVYAVSGLACSLPLLFFNVFLHINNQEQVKPVSYLMWEKDVVPIKFSIPIKSKTALLDINSGVKND